MITAAKPIANGRRSLLKRGLLMPMLWNIDQDAVVQVDAERDVSRVTYTIATAGRCRLYTRLLYGSPRRNCGLAFPHVRSIRWKIRNSNTMMPVQRIVRDAKSAAT